GRRPLSAGGRRGEARLRRGNRLHGAERGTGLRRRQHLLAPRPRWTVARCARRADDGQSLEARSSAPHPVGAAVRQRTRFSATRNCVIRRVANDANRTVTTVAGAYFAGTWADGIGSAARLSYPMGMAWLDATHIVIADSSNHAIRVLDVTTRAVTTLAITHNG